LNTFCTHSTPILPVICWQTPRY